MNWRKWTRTQNFPRPHMQTKRSVTTTSDIEMRYKELWALAQTAPHFIGTKGWSKWLDRLDDYKPENVISGGSFSAAGKVKKSGVGAPCGDCR